MGQLIPAPSTATFDSHGTLELHGMYGVYLKPNTTYVVEINTPTSQSLVTAPDYSRLRVAFPHDQPHYRAQRPLSNSHIDGRQRRSDNRYVSFGTQSSIVINNWDYGRLGFWECERDILHTLNLDGEDFHYYSDCLPSRHLDDPGHPDHYNNEPPDRLWWIIAPNFGNGPGSSVAAKVLIRECGPDDPC